MPIELLAVCVRPVNSHMKLFAKSVSNCPPAAKLRVKPLSALWSNEFDFGKELPPPMCE